MSSLLGKYLCKQKMISDFLIYPINAFSIFKRWCYKPLLLFSNKSLESALGAKNELIKHIFLLSWLYGKYDGLCSSLIPREAYVSVWYFTLKIIRDSRTFFKAKPCRSCALMNSFLKNASLMQTVKSIIR